ncbi:thiamine phosphate synthase [Alicyclobacillus fastidiosus]|uniref:thiamine phosphate synthase n=1 Tax=Alicyclobacillus fastidiosus TaxID=392011 RepID=UPI0024E06ADA|nr:thiamine phosphate synthase [Alicyclobacillus fastidiosus]
MIETATACLCSKRSWNLPKAARTSFRFAKKAPASETYGLVRELQQICTEERLSSRIFVNDRVDIALSTDVAGVHLAAKSLPIPAVAQLRRQTGWHGLIGCSVHALDEAIRAERAGADYVTFGHVFASESHPGLPPRGLYALRRVAEALSIPVIAIGGIDKTNVGAVLETGCSGVAVIGSVLNAEDPLDAVKCLKAAMEKSDVSPKVPFRLAAPEYKRADPLTASHAKEG